MLYILIWDRYVWYFLFFFSVYDWSKSIVHAYQGLHIDGILVEFKNPIQIKIIEIWIIASNWYGTDMVLNWFISNPSACFHLQNLSLA